MEDPKKAYNALLADLEGVMPETPLELKLRKKMEFDSLEQGRLGHVDFHVKFRKLLVEMDEANCMNLDDEDLYLAYVTKLNPACRAEVVKRRMIFEDEQLVRTAKSWQECKVVLGEMARENRNLAAIRERQTVHTTDTPPAGGVGSTSRCKY